MPTGDSRLLGTWRSDRRRTFRHYKPKAGCSPQALAGLKAMFGKLVVRWGRGKYHTELEGHRESGGYEVVASDSVSVVVRYQDFLSGEDRLRQIHFDGDYYWIALGGGLCEYFRRIKRPRRESRRRERGRSRF
jgi:hypothetical protein